MKGAFILSRHPGIYADIEAAIRRHGGYGTLGEYVYLEENGRRLAIFGQVGPESDYDLSEPVASVRGTGEPPHIPPAKGTVCWTECRWEEMLAHWMQEIESELGYELWVWDNRAVLWRASEIDPTELAL